MEPVSFATRSAQGIASGSLAALARWPVKSLGGEWLDRAQLTRGGVEGDRRYTVIDLQSGGTLSAAEHPQLLTWTAGGSTIRDAEGRRWAFGDAATCRALSAELERTVTLRRHPDGQHYHPGTVLVTVEGSRLEVERELGELIDLRRFRPNLHLQLDCEPFAELGWTGNTLRVGDATLEFLHPCDRCVIAARDPDTGQKRPELLRLLNRRHDLLFGIFAVVREAAAIEVGDAARVE